jgi:5,10-methylenetetrahydromethanopterin reductase
MSQISIALQTDKTPAEYVALAQMIDRYDFDVVSVYCDAPFQPSYAPLLLMAPHLKRARLGPAAVSPARIHPIDIASQTALLAQLALGGVYIGIARGAWLAEHGIQEPAKPIQSIREAVEVVRYLLEGRSGGYVGEIYSLAPYVRALYVLPTASIPIMIGTWGRSLCVLAGAIADEVKVGGTANPDLIPVIRGYIGTERVGICVGAVTVVDDDRDQARAVARHEVALYLPVVAPLDPTLSVEPELIAQLKLHVEQGDKVSAANLISDDLLDRFAFAGNPADIIRQSESLFAAGASRIEFGTPHGLPSAKGIQVLGENVIPTLRRRL